MRLPKAIRIGWGAIAKTASGTVGSMVSLRPLIFLASREQSSAIDPDAVFESMTLISVSPACTMPEEAMAWDHSLRDISVAFPWMGQVTVITYALWGIEACIILLTYSSRLDFMLRSTSAVYVTSSSSMVLWHCGHRSIRFSMEFLSFSDRFSLNRGPSSLYAWMWAMFE